MRATNSYSLDAMYLMMATAMMESKLTHLKQLPEGPAIGLFQIEPATYFDVIRYLVEVNRYHGDKVLHYLNRGSFPADPLFLASDLALSVLIARYKYWMITEPIPSYKDTPGQAAYYKRYYNTAEGAASIESFEKCAQDLGGWINHGDMGQS